LFAAVNALFTMDAAAKLQPFTCEINQDFGPLKPRSKSWNGAGIWPFNRDKVAPYLQFQAIPNQSLSQATLSPVLPTVPYHREVLAEHAINTPAPCKIWTKQRSQRSPGNWQSQSPSLWNRQEVEDSSRAHQGSCAANKPLNWVQ
jgi:hypothetical protein